MSDVPFHLTRMGVRFYEHTMPELVRQLDRLTMNLGRVPEAAPPKTKWPRLDEEEAVDEEQEDH